jgi:hypothetical protein
LAPDYSFLTPSEQLPEATQRNAARRSLQLSALTFRGNPLTTEIAVLWRGTRRLPRYAEAFSAMFAEHMRTVVGRFEEED